MKPVAYLVSEYPAVSHTFIRREVAALRARGVDIATFSVRPPDRAAPGANDGDARSTQAILGRSPLVYVAAYGWALGRAPRWFFSTLALALRHRAPGMRAAIWSLFHLIEALLAARLFDRAGIGHVHAHFANSGATVAMLAAHYLRLPWSMTLHGVSETDYPAGLLLADKIARARFVACASHFMQAQAMRAADPVHWDKLLVVRCGIDAATLPAARGAPAGDAITFICVGRLSPEKGYHGLLRAFARVHAGDPGARLEIVGSGPLADELARTIGAMACRDAITLRGALAEADTLAAIAAADALVLASFMEGLPVVLIEAMALGKPVIASGIAGIPELVHHEATGLLFAPSDWDALAAAMGRIAADPALRQRLGRAARESALARHAIDIAVAPLVARFRDGEACD